MNISSRQLLHRLCSKRSHRFEQCGFRKELEAIAEWLIGGCYSHGACDSHLLRLHVVLESMKGWTPSAVYTESALSGAFRKKITSPLSRARYGATRRLYEKFLLSQGRLVVTAPSDRFASIRRRYQEYLRQFRDLAPSTLVAHDGTVGDFLIRVLSSRRRLASLRSADVGRYVQLRSRDTTRRTLQNIVTRLRAFLRYGHGSGEIPSPLDAIDLPRVFRGELPPRALNWRTIQALLRSIDRRSKGGWRDYAILHLMAHYGLRPSEIIALRLDSIDWKACTLRVSQCKTHSTLVLPLAPPTITVLRRYLTHRSDPGSRRPAQLFLRLPSPHVALRQSAVSLMFDKRVRQSGLPVREYSAYSLRHGFAMRLLERGVGIKAIGDVMGHRDLHSTCMYLRLDTRTLREVALPVPGSSSRSGARRG